MTTSRFETPAGFQSNYPENTDLCTCGHTRGQHYLGGECCISIGHGVFCPCACFELAPDGERVDTL